MTNKKTSSLSAQLNKLTITVIVSAGSLIVIILSLFLFYSLSASRVSHNIADASRFNQDFKDTVDLKMYYFVTDSEYTTGTPMEEVDYAMKLAAELEGVTSNKDSLRAISNVISLCENLKNRITEIENAPGYIDRMQQLEANIYIITELIQNYMYTYLYYEAGELARLQNQTDAMLVFILVISVLASAVLFFFAGRRSKKITKSITDPIDTLYNRTKEIGEGNLSIKEPVPASDEKIQALSIAFEEMLERLNNQMELNRQEAEQIKKMEFMLLQAQINPHFLYNTLETIVWLIEIGQNDKAVEMVASLSNFFRTSLSKGRDVITLREEELHARSYLEIQQVRYKDILKYNIDISDELKELNIPKLTLQPIIENAIYHGIKLKRGGGKIEIKGDICDGDVILSVEDTGIGMNEETRLQLIEAIKSENSKGFGMSAVYKRLKLMYGEKCEMLVESREGEGTIITFVIDENAMKQYSVREGEHDEK